MLLRAMLGLVLGLGAAQAQEVAVPATPAAPAASALMEAMPAKRLKALKASPEGFLEDAAELIYATGHDGRIDAAGIDDFIALRRAEVRAGRMRPFLAADLNNDGAIGRAEVGLFATALTARRRGDVLWGFDVADADGDGSVTMPELRSLAETAAMMVLDDVDAAGLRSLILFDQDKDGAVAMDEVVSVVGALLEK